MEPIVKKYFLGALVAVVAVGFFVRAYHFEPWLHFELDQARDAKVIDEAFQGGFWDLPLLGPKAGGTFLRLAPGFYYLQYVSGLLFGKTVPGISWFVVIFSTATLPFLYLFLRRGFREGMSLGLTALASVCVYLVLFGRFGWNPNLLPFFLVFGFYALLRAVEKDSPKRTTWFLSATFLLTLATHFHFLAFLAVPVIVILFLLIKQVRFSWSAWGGAFIIILFLYSPMLINEIKTQGSNTSEFFGAISEKSTKEQRTLIEKSVRDVAEFGQASVVMLTGYEGATFPSVVANSKEWGTVCDKKCDEGKWYGVAGALFFFLGLGLMVRRWWRAHNWQEADFYLLTLIWLGVSLAIYLPLSYAIAPRFYLLSAPLFFVLLGVILSSFCRHKINKIIAYSILGILIISNTHFLSARFNELARADNEAVESRPDRILKERIRVTLEQEQSIVNFLASLYRERGVPVYMASEPQYQRALKYLLEKEGVVTDGVKLSGIYRQGQYFLVLRSNENLKDRLVKYKDVFEIGDITSFGTLSVVEMIPKPEAIQAERQDFSIPEKKADSKAPLRYTWREVFGHQKASLEEDDTQDDEGDN